MEERSIISEFYKMDNQTPFEYTPFELFGDIHLITLGIILSVSLIFSFTARQYYDKNTFAGFEKILGYLLIIIELIKPFFLPRLETMLKRIFFMLGFIGFMLKIQ